MPDRRVGGAIAPEEARRRIGVLPDVSRETLDGLDGLVDLVRRWTLRVNLVSERDAGFLWDRHLLDSFGLWEVLRRRRPALWVDLGSGGGFPVLPLAVAAREAGYPVRFIAVEADQRKAAFLRVAASDLSVPLAVTAMRIEKLSGIQADLVSARALASVDRLLDWTRMAGLSAPMALLKGRQVDDELTAASRRWHMRFHKREHPLVGDGYILELEGTSRCESASERERGDRTHG